MAAYLIIAAGVASGGGRRIGARMAHAHISRRIARVPRSRAAAAARRVRRK